MTGWRIFLWLAAAINRNLIMRAHDVLTHVDVFYRAGSPLRQKLIAGSDTKSHGIISNTDAAGKWDEKAAEGM